MALEYGRLVTRGAISRRALLLGVGGSVTAAAGGFALVDDGVLPGRRALHRALGACDVGGSLPSVAPGPIRYGSLASAARRRTVAYAIVYPPGTHTNASLPVCLYLHGRGGDHRDVSGRRIGLPWILADRVRAGSPPIVLVGADGGVGYWHRRASGDDAGRMLFDELVPMLHARGFRTERIGLMGASMGGYGALLWSERLGRRRVAAVGAMSPAIWHRYPDSAPGAFDSAADFAAHDVFAGIRRLSGIPVRVDCGKDDSFADATRDFLARAPSTTSGAISDGCHDPAFWRSAAYGQIANMARHLG
jgi:S-formylglutathione hydrolase FrmB